MLSIQTLFFALLGGILPALLWLWFWLKEDKKRPEPRGLIILAFVAGMVSVPLVIPLEQIVKAFSMNITLLTVTLWAAIEEIMKYAAAILIILRRKAVDEPIDTIIYMITIALGFAALENTFFLLNSDIGIVDNILTGNLRFLGATLLHVLASATIGVAMAFSFYKSESIQKIFRSLGLILAIVLHSSFNFFIINSNGEKILIVFLFVWIGVIILLLSFEKVKHITKLIIKK